jgi:hypothetical protein
VTPSRHFVIVFALAVSAAACSGINSQTYSYATLAEAERAGAMTNGWIPRGLPPGTHDIRAAQVPGTVKRWGIINFPSGEADVLRALLEPTEMSLEGQHAEAPARIEWWPIALRGEINGERLTTTHIHGYRTKQGGLVFAVNWNQGRAYYWNAALP